MPCSRTRVPTGTWRGWPIAATRLMAQYNKYSLTGRSACTSFDTGIDVLSPRTNSLMVPLSGRFVSRTCPSPVTRRVTIESSTPMSADMRASSYTSEHISTASSNRASAAASPPTWWSAAQVSIPSSRISRNMSGTASANPDTSSGVSEIESKVSATRFTPSNDYNVALRALETRPMCSVILQSCSSAISPITSNGASTPLAQCGTSFRHVPCRPRGFDSLGPVYAR